MIITELRIYAFCFHYKKQNKNKIKCPSLHRFTVEIKWRFQPCWSLFSVCISDFLFWFDDRSSDTGDIDVKFSIKSALIQRAIWFLKLLIFIFTKFIFYATHFYELCKSRLDTFDFQVIKYLKILFSWLLSCLQHLRS